MFQLSSVRLSSVFHYHLCAVTRQTLLVCYARVTAKTPLGQNYWAKTTFGNAERDTIHDPALCSPSWNILCHTFFIVFIFFSYWCSFLKERKLVVSISMFLYFLQSEPINNISPFTPWHTQTIIKLLLFNWETYCHILFQHYADNRKPIASTIAVKSLHLRTHRLVSQHLYGSNASMETSLRWRHRLDMLGDQTKTLEL